MKIGMGTPAGCGALLLGLVFLGVPWAVATVSVNAFAPHWATWRQTMLWLLIFAVIAVAWGALVFWIDGRRDKNRPVK